MDRQINAAGIRGALSPREVALLADTTVPTVKKAVQQHKLKASRVGGRVVLEPRAVLAMAAFTALGARLSAPANGRLRDSLFAPGEAVPELIEISDALVLRITTEMRGSYERALEYVAARDAHIECRPEILGGAPIVKGTRLAAHALAARIDGGEALAELEGDYPEVPSVAIRAAVDFARSHPPVGRPRTPWRASVA